MIRLEGVSKRFGRVQALQGIDLAIGEGVFGLLGPNGAGKTTLMRVLVTLLPPDTGSASVLGYDIRRHKREIRRVLGYLPQEFHAYGSFTGREYLEYMALLKELPSGQLRRRIESRNGLSATPTCGWSMPALPPLPPP